MYDLFIAYVEPLKRSELAEACALIGKLNSINKPPNQATSIRLAIAELAKVLSDANQRIYFYPNERLGYLIYNICRYFSELN
jgi:hypothetical protein